MIATHKYSPPKTQYHALVLTSEYTLHPQVILGKKSFCKTSFQVGMELKKVQKQGRDERTQEDYPTSAKIHTRCRVVFLRSFISALFLYFFRLHPYLKSSFTETFPLVSVLFLGVSKPISN